MFAVVAFKQFTLNDSSFLVIQVRETKKVSNCQIFCPKLVAVTQEMAD